MTEKHTQMGLGLDQDASRIREGQQRGERINIPEEVSLPQLLQGGSLRRPEWARPPGLEFHPLSSSQLPHLQNGVESATYHIELPRKRSEFVDALRTCLGHIKHHVCV